MRIFRIGDFARRMGVSAHLLKHYEQEGLIRPKTRPNGYRFYTLHDSSVLLQCRGMRNLDFSVRDTKALLFGPDFGALCAALDERAAGLAQELARKQELLAELTRQRAFLPRMQAGESEQIETEPVWYLLHVADGTFCAGDATYTMLQAWMEWMPIVCSLLEIPPEALAEGSIPQEARRFGLVLPAAAAERCGIPTGAPAYLLPPQRVRRFYLAAAAGPRGEQIAAAERACVEALSAYGETAAGTLRKTVLFYNAEGEARMQYSLLDIPLA